MNLRRGLTLACFVLAMPLGASAQLHMDNCRLAGPWLGGVAADCGKLTVAEEPGAPGGRAIDLFVARVPSLNPDPEADPLVIIAGGPGQAATDFYPSVRAAFEQVRRDRDLIVVDQRGTGRSAPLACPQANAASLERVDAQALPGLMRACLAELDGDPRFYTTSVAVTDLESVREALGISQWNLYGVSYGTRVAQHYLRRHPDHTRAVILDGVVPSDTPLGPDVAVQAQRVLDQILTRCAQAPSCAARYPALPAHLDALLRGLRDGSVEVALRDPLTAEPAMHSLTGEQVASVIRLLSYTPQTAALLPLLVESAHSGDYAPIAAQSRLIARELESALSLPMHNAVVCTEDVPLFADRPASAELEATYLGTSIVDALEAACSVWPIGVLDDDLHAPLRSDRPVLLLSGGADPITPPDYAERVRATLGRARHLVGPEQGHGLAAVGCTPRLMREFLVSLDAASLDASCLERERASPFFIDFNGPAP